MNFTKKLISICLSAICFCPNICAMKSSVSMPENLYRYARDEREKPKITDYSLYGLYKSLNRIIINSPDTPTETIIKDTSYVCSVIFSGIYDLLSNRDVPNRYYYVSCLLNYIPLINDLNYILNDIVPDKVETSDPCFPASDEAKRILHTADSAVSLVMTRYMSIFEYELNAAFLESTQVQKIYDLLCDTHEGVSYISGITSFRI